MENSEVVKVLEQFKYHEENGTIFPSGYEKFTVEALTQAIASLQAYEELKKRIEVEGIFKTLRYTCASPSCDKTCPGYSPDKTCGVWTKAKKVVKYLLEGK